ncbi:helix-turn-helix domain-containing protein [Flavivirga spongiicola]|uniref:Helix-turn-helix domain-containing protein n=1 Tax=Flavivirga spongiicola TaxID=421621 RepID=A0ABU7XLH8_9FLAO|nr:helix-turn-helix domain-containing protein [Flavivirga sp. MEBiC05379]MDO5981265.1 helix-turn-helix domain-containing protein [Flavivirga sp. MEBiC05379]
MNFENQIIFFLSALGAFNGLLLSIYFAYSTKYKKFTNYFLSLLLFVLSIRIIKSVFFYFNQKLSVTFIQIGLSACVLIGPALYLYIVSTLKETTPKRWLIHIVPLVFLLIILGIIYPYWSYKELWSRFIIKGIYLQWLIYIIITGFQLKHILKKVFSKTKKLNEIEVWLLSIFTGVSIIWFSYNIGSYTSYIVGALSFSFVFYLLVLLWLFKRNKNTLFFDEKVKYGNKKIDREEVKSIIEKLTIIKDKKLFKNPNLKLSDVAKQLNIPPHQLSQLLNDNLGKSFSLFINELRIEEAKQLLISSDVYTIETIGYDCGFNSKSTFFTTFKKITETTPAKYKKEKSQKGDN